MLSTPHLFIGAALGVRLGSPAAAFVVGVVSHHLADCVLHTDPGTFRTGVPDNPEYSAAEAAVAVTDLLVGMTLLYLATREHPRRLAAAVGALAAIVPDVVDNGPYAARFRATRFGQRYHAMHHRMHWTATPRQWLPGLATQAVAGLLAALLLRR